MTPKDAVYTHGHHASVLRSHTWRTARNSAEYLLPELRPGQQLLDVGCGPGTITADLAALVAPGRVTGVENTPGILEQAAYNAAEAGAENTVFEVADVHALPYADDSFDVVHAHQVLQHVADPVQALREMRRVCRPGGVVAVRDADYAAFFWYPQIPALDEWLRLYERTARANGGEPDAGRRLHAWAREAGFTDVTPGSSTWTYATEAERTWWGELWAERATVSPFAAHAVRSGFATPADLQRIAEGWRAWAADPDGWLTIPHGEMLCRP
ncbi:methyltransferase domain-containing protein [Streptacidiphilus sp. PB12-B1b]|uniref:methyltransferase domain-containing protein n=1 Tax=Streptacidiphilus sp. PB12-B1b TaxID=2705012 RepID=UPI0015FD9AD9|nr:methyltransferase domain-containing protein [Streptacidiphilus sp. PB12-B1b]QMU78756.1 methyltransferase domain-containing protein [Streptacidiphilus sp. PB12-B1b]